MQGKGAITWNTCDWAQHVKLQSTEEETDFYLKIYITKMTHFTFHSRRPEKGSPRSRHWNARVASEILSNQSGMMCFLRCLAVGKYATAPLLHVKVRTARLAHPATRRPKPCPAEEHWFKAAAATDSDCLFMVLLKQTPPPTPAPCTFGNCKCRICFVLTVTFTKWCRWHTF